MKANRDKFQFTILRKTGSHKLQIGDITPKSVSSITLLDITIGSKLNFKSALLGLRQFLADEGPFKMMKNTFYFTLKSLFVLKIFRFLS